MKRLFSVLAAISITIFLSGQDTQDLVAHCSLNSGENTTSIKNFVIKLPHASDPSSIPVHKANMYLMKNQTYRFTMCNSENSEGKLILTLFDNQKEMVSSHIKKSGNIYNSIDFPCKKTGLYQLWYNFKDGEKGYGVGIVSIVR